MSVFGVTVARHGETIDFGSLGKVKASLKASTKATYSLANRAYYIEGQCFRTSPDMFAEGDYFTRENDSGRYFVSTVQTEPLAADLVYLYGIRCNAVISLYRCKGYTDSLATKSANGKPSPKKFTASAILSTEAARPPTTDL